MSRTVPERKRMYVLYRLIDAALNYASEHIYGVFIVIVAVIVISVLLAKSQGRKIVVTTKADKDKKKRP